MGEHLPCKQGVKSSNLSISIPTEVGDRTLKTAYIDQDKRLRVKDRTGDGDVRDDHQISRHPRHVHRGMYVNKSKIKI